MAKPNPYDINRPAMQTLTPAQQGLIQAELNRFEKVLWSSTPNPGRLAKKTLPVVIFAIPWTAFSLFWIASASGFKWPDLSGGFGLFPLFGLPFLLIGLGMLLSPLLVAKKAAATAYAITNERAIIIEPGWFGGMNIRSFFPHQLSDIRKVQFADGNGDLILDNNAPTDNRRGNATDIGFFGIADVKKVEALIFVLANPSAA
ncbi:MAG: hypothetical protein PHU14_08835 [Methylovulum sp.]|nr:hypothetical protein [Methylovulum sp.]